MPGRVRFLPSRMVFRLSHRAVPTMPFAPVTRIFISLLLPRKLLLNVGEGGDARLRFGHVQDAGVVGIELREGAALLVPLGEKLVVIQAAVVGGDPVEVPHVLRLGAFLVGEEGLVELFAVADADDPDILLFAAEQLAHRLRLGLDGAGGGLLDKEVSVLSMLKGEEDEIDGFLQRHDEAGHGRLGDGDGLAIGGNHFIHAVRRNIDLNMILLNNRIYGLTKGQYSPTSPRGFVSKSSPYGTVEDPFHPAELCFGARGRFFARAVATDGPGTVEVLKAAANHKGASVCEILQNCVIFNDGTHESVYNKEGRAKNAIYLEHGKPMLFGENKEFGLMQEGFGLKVVKLGENGITEKDILIHDAHCMDNTLQLKLALMEGPDFPIALGVIRDVKAPTYDDAVHEQIDEVSAKKKYHNFRELLMTNDIWEVK